MMFKLSKQVIDKLPGKIIVFDGLNGAGKTSLISRLSDHFDAENVKHEIFREPGGTRTGEKIRDIVISPGGEKMSPETEALLFMAARSHLARTRIASAIASNVVVLLDRWASTTYAHQGELGLADHDFVSSYCIAVPSELRPHVIFILDVPVELARKRVFERASTINRGNRWDDQTVEFYAKVRERFLGYGAVSGEPVCIIDVIGDKDAVLDRALREIDAFF